MWNIWMPDAGWYGDDATGTELQGIVRHIEDASLVAIDTETTGLNIVRDIPLYWSISWRDRQGAPYRVCLKASHLNLFRHCFQDPNKAWIFCNAKYDAHILANVGIHIQGTWYDTAVMHALLYEEMPHGLKETCAQILGWKWRDFKDTFGAVRKGGKTLQEKLGEAEQFDLTTLVEYASNDAYGTYELFLALKRELEAANTYSLYPDRYATLWDIYHKTEVPFTKVLWKCERAGIKVDTGFLQSKEGPMLRDMRDIEKEIARVAGRILNPNSPADLRNFFFTTKGYKPKRLTKGGKTGIKQPSADAEFLEELDDPVAKLILQYRDISKTLGTYVHGLIESADANGRVHTRYNQDIARCLPAGELVLTNRGYIPVEQVKVGDLAITHEGRVRPVIATSTHAPKPIYHIELNNGLVLRTTGNHEYKTAHGWCRADDLQQGDEVVTHSDKEEWAGIPSYRDYSISSWGRVRNETTGRMLALNAKSIGGHLKVTIRCGGRKKDFAVHRLVADAFVLGKFDKAEIRHLDGTAWNNTRENLMWGTSKENTEDSRIRSTLNGSPKLTRGQVEEIRATQSAGQPPSTTRQFCRITVEAIHVEEAEVTYGLTVEEDHSHVTGGIVTHNTGRLSSSSPNLQNIKRPDEDEYRIRQAFIAAEGTALIVRDYEQLEMRLLACAAMEADMIDIFRKNWDIHMGNASLVFQAPYDDIAAAKKVDKQVKEGKLPETAMTDYVRRCLHYRQAAKSVGFGLNYGMKENKLARQIGVTVEEAKSIIEQYMARYPAVANFYKEAIEEARSTGYAFTLLGRRRSLPDILSENSMDRWTAERQASNQPIQGTAADVVRLAMIQIDESGILESRGARMLLQVHDEICVECPTEYAKEVNEDLKEIMEHPLPNDLAVLLATSGGIGPNWCDAKLAPRTK